MRLSVFKDYLLSYPEHQLRFVLPSGNMIEPNAHISEVGRVERLSMDCGGTVRRNSYCVLQAWVSEDLDHRISPFRLASIILAVQPLLGDEDLRVEVEYDDNVISQYPVVAAGTDDHALYFHIEAKGADCLARDICIGSGAFNSACC